MKIRNHRKYTWWFFPHDDSNLVSKNNKQYVVNKCYRFKFKSEMMDFLQKNIYETIGGEVRLEEETFNSTSTIRAWNVWYNDYTLHRTSNFKIVLRQLPFRGKKFISKPQPMEKDSKKYFAFSNKINSLMSRIGNSEIITENSAKKLVDLFYKRGYKDFEPDEETLEYINSNINDGIPFNYWSDRCNFVRIKAVIEYFKREKLI